MGDTGKSQGIHSNLKWEPGDPQQHPKGHPGDTHRTPGHPQGTPGERQGTPGEPQGTPSGTPGGPQESPRDTPGGPQRGPQGTSTNPAPTRHRGVKNVVFSWVLIGKVDPGNFCRHRPATIFGTTCACLKPTRTLSCFGTTVREIWPTGALQAP